MSPPPTAEQRRAADPARSIWVTANAGTGKTRVLTDRVLRLLLAGAAPEGILCLTFTKAAAAEMIVRIEERLASWAIAADAALAAELEDLLGAPAAPELPARARRLFAEVLDLPQGLPIMTIHAFCGSLLRRFPLEAGVAPRFETIDDQTAAELMAEARSQILTRAREDRDELGSSVGLLAVALAEGALDSALREVLAARSRLQQASGRCGGFAGLAAYVYEMLGAVPDLVPATVVEQVCEQEPEDVAGLREAGKALGADDRATDLAAWLSASAAERVRLFDAYASVFLTKDGTRRKTLLAKPLATAHPGALDSMEREADRLLAVRNAIKVQETATRTRALLCVGLAIVETYAALKRQRGALDFEDLIERARALLERDGAAGWVHFKLDARIDHVLVDEAQDTAPAQWRIVELLTRPFFEGAGARPASRTLFVVGDEKQSIYSFQGADLEAFRTVRERLWARAEAAQVRFGEELLDRSFRSTAAVLALVDAVLALPEARSGVADADASIVHRSERPHDEGIVELWPLAAPTAQAPSEQSWPLPDEAAFVEEPAAKVARAIASTIRGWLDRGERLGASGKPIRAGDVLVLFSRRGTFQELLIRLLRDENVAVTGADRLTLADHIAVRDLVALGRAALLPEDDLNLACLIRSPLLGLSETDLFDLAWDRGSASLLERFRAAAEAEPDRFGDAYARLARWLRRADFMPPFEFFAWLLGSQGGRARLLARLGREAEEPIEAFLGQTLAYERGHPASLEGFLHWFELGGDTLKRDPERSEDAVRVMTVHGAKGLEAPIVFLADAGAQATRQSDRLVWSGDDARAGCAIPFWRGSEAQRDDVTEDFCARAKTAAERERRRLLYVALTRAKDRLYIAGWRTRTKSGAKDPSWHDLVQRAFDGLGDRVERVPATAPLEGEILRLRMGQALPAKLRTEQRPDRPAAVPGWLRVPAPPEPRPPRPLAPSRTEPEPPAPAAPLGHDARARIRIGALTHRLLELVPRLPEAGRAEAVTRFLEARARDLGPAERARIERQVHGLLSNPELAPLFGPAARAEQPLAGVVDGVAFAGQVDRLLVTPEQVLVADFKTGRPVSPVPPAYQKQLLTYRGLVEPIFPGRAVRCALIWVETGEAVWLDRTSP